MIKVSTNHVQVDFDGQCAISAEKVPTAGGWIFAVKIEATRNFKTPGRSVLPEEGDDSAPKIYLSFRQTDSLDVLIDMLKKLKKHMRSNT
jgi:hypothetical protein